MDLNLTMRYVMVQAQKEASGKSAQTTHLFLGLLTLSMKNASELSSDTQMQLRIESDLQAVKRLLEMKRVQANEVQTKLRLLLVGDPSPTETDASDVLLQAMDVCNRQGKTEVTAYITLNLILNSPTELIKKALEEASTPPPPEEVGKDTVFATAGTPQVGETAWGESRFTAGGSNFAAGGSNFTERGSNFMAGGSRFAEGGSRFAEGGSNFTEGGSSPAAGGNGVVIFDIPAPGEAGSIGAQNPPNPPYFPRSPLNPYQSPESSQQSPNQPEMQSPIILDSPYKPFKPKTKINGFTISGEVAWAAVKYFWWVLVLPAIVLCVLEAKWNMISVPSTNKWQGGLPYVIASFGLYLTLFGIVSLVRRRLKAFAVFLNFLTSVVFIASFIALYLRFYNKEALSTFEVVILWIVIICMLLYSLNSLSLLKNTSTGASYSMNTAMFQIGGTPAVIFFTFMMRALILPVLAGSILMIFNLSFSAAWKAIFYIYGFLWAWGVIRMIFKCNVLRFRTNTPQFRTWNFWHAQSNMLFLPALGLFLMWYFGWFPMKTWLVWIYSIYAVFWLIFTFSLLFTMKK